ncbi:MAG: hypothetical protein F4X81_12695 [Gammaproteobacteria bacterium]|nr:hypothetical protein [Gammaproteobacteria bacterium]MXY06767.1 hypothetical protein [Gammaproteobacteria bacterium]MYE52312.1 hypothetical protein [Gammaproteobacteria bacterium]MYG12700.1 hypothetical protein [Gammaproteobacteria bacterium]
MIRSLPLLALCAAVSFAACAEELALVGSWTLNVDRTEAIQPDNSTSRWWEGLGGNFSTSVSVGSEELRPGAYRGMRSQWSRRKLTSNYESTTRKVKRSLEVGRDGRLLMSVTINPRKGKTLRYKRVFDRA